MDVSKTYEGQYAESGSEEQLVTYRIACPLDTIDPTRRTDVHMRFVDCYDTQNRTKIDNFI